MKKIFAAVLAITLIFTSACNKSDTSSSTNSSISGTGDIKSDEVIVTVSAEGRDLSKYNIVYDEYLRQFKNFLYYYGIENDTDEGLKAYAIASGGTGTDEEIANMRTMMVGVKEQILDYLTRERLYLINADDAGLGTLSEEKQAEITANLDEYFQSIHDNFLTEAQSELPDASVEEQEKLAAEKADEYIEKSGIDRDTLQKWNERAVIADNLTEQLLKDITVTDSEKEEYITEQTAAAKAAYESDVYSYEQSEIYSKYYVPEGTKQIQHILIKLPDEVVSELYTMEDGEAKTARKAEEMVKILPTAQEVLDKVNAGGNFDELITEYSEDGGPASGYPIVPKSVSFVSAFVTGAAELSNIGETSGLVESEYGYHILKYASDVNPLSKDELMTLADTEVKTEKENEKLVEMETLWESQITFTVNKALLGIEETSESSENTSGNSETASE